MEAYPLYDYIQLHKLSATNTQTERGKGIYQFQIPQGFYYSNQRSSVATIEVVSAMCSCLTDVVVLETLNLGLVQPTPANANTLGNDTDAPPIMCSFDNIGKTTGRQAVYQQENPKYQISARPSQITIKFFQDALAQNQDDIDDALNDFIILLKMTYYDPIKNIATLNNQFTPTLNQHQF